MTQRRRHRKNPYAVALGRLGGKISSPAKTRAVRENGKKGGRPREAVPVHPVHVKLPSRQYDELYRESRREGISVQELIRRRLPA